MKDIVSNKLLKMAKDVEQKHGIKVKVTKDVVRYIVEENMDTQSSSGGARAAVSKLESEVTMAVARYINAHPDISGIMVSVGGQMAVDNKYMKDSDAYIMISPVS
jgi:ATP-dependent Clp protease ATP-binding subunit ClpA